jgi:hypothetical protein
MLVRIRLARVEYTIILARIRLARVGHIIMLAIAVITLRLKILATIVRNKKKRKKIVSLGVEYWF